MAGRITRLLNWINHPPLAFTVKHYFEFGDEYGDLDSAEAWDELRETHPHFAVPKTREEWIESLTLKKDGQDSNLQLRAEEIVALCRKHGIRRIHSVGAGTGALEYFIKKTAPDIEMLATDYNPIGTARLREMFTECDRVEVFDIHAKDWHGFGDGTDALVILYRVDPHFTDAEWRTIFENMHASGVKNVLSIPCNTLTLRHLYGHKKTGFVSWLKGRKVSFAGYVRTRAMFRTYWKGLYKEEYTTMGHLRAYFLTSD